MVLFGSADAAETHFFVETHALAFANFYTRLLQVPEHLIPDYWSFTVYFTCFGLYVSIQMCHHQTLFHDISGSACLYH
jgi:hypothetical protein